MKLFAWNMICLSLVNKAGNLIRYDVEISYSFRDELQIIFKLVKTQVNFWQILKKVYFHKFSFVFCVLIDSEMLLIGVYSYLQLQSTSHWLKVSYVLVVALQFWDNWTQSITFRWTLGKKKWRNKNKKTQKFYHDGVYQKQLTIGWQNDYSDIFRKILTKEPVVKSFIH